jgi:pilus assembly protein CpaE
MHMKELADVRIALPLKIAVLSPEVAMLDELRHQLQSWDSSLRLTLAPGGVGEAGATAEHEQPDVLLIEGARHDVHELAELERLTARYPALAVILLSPNQSAEFLRHAMRIGLREVLSVPLSRDALIEAVGRVRQRLSAASAPRSKGRIFSFVGCKGGSGATFLATNLAYALAQNAQKKIGLIDLNCQLGDAALYVTQRAAGSTLADVAQQVHRLDAPLLMSSMIQVTPNFHLLPAPEEPEQALHIRPEHIDPLLGVAAGCYDFVIIDAGRSLNEVSVRAMDHSETVFAVLQLNLPFLRDAKRLLHALTALGYAKEKVQLVVNRFEKNAAISLADVTETLRREIFKTIPNSFEAVSASMNQGEPISRLSPRDAVTRALRELAAVLLPEITPSPGWLRSMLVRN